MCDNYTDKVSGGESHNLVAKAVLGALVVLLKMLHYLNDGCSHLHHS